MASRNQKAPVMVQPVDIQKYKAEVVGVGNPMAVSEEPPIDSQPVTIADGDDATQGTIADAAVSTDTTGTVSGKLRGLIKLVIAKITVILDTGSGAGATIGLTTNAAVVTDADGTLSGKLRGIIKLLVDKITAIVVMKTGDATYQVPRLDAITHAQDVIDHAHSQIHDGESFSAQYSITTAATSGHRSGLFIKTPATVPLVHVVVTFAVSVAARYSICEAPTIAANTGSHGGAIINRYRDHATASGCFDNANAPVVAKYTTLSEAQIAGDGSWAVGTVIRTNPLVSGGGPKPAGGSTRDTQEYILKANTKYVFLITNLTADANVHDITIDWYEHENKAA